MAFVHHIWGFFIGEEGATAMEYGLLTALIAAAIMTALSSLGTAINDTFTAISNAITGAAS